MNPVRKRRLIMVGLVLLAAAAAATFIALALQENINYLHTPSEVRTGKAPESSRFRLGGVVCNGSVQRTEGQFNSSILNYDAALRLHQSASAKADEHHHGHETEDLYEGPKHSNFLNCHLGRWRVP